MTIGKIRRVPVREVWVGEAKDFTPWLENNIEQLNESLGLSLSIMEREKRVGDFYVDLLAVDSNGDKVIIECQLEETNHDHLGKLLVYLSNLEAKSAIWICLEPRPEHTRAINWLNEFAPQDISFYLVQVQTIRIENSPPAPLFTKICAPSEQTREIGEEKEEFAERHLKRIEFWKQLLEKANSKTKLHSRTSPSKANWISTGVRPGLWYNYWITYSSAGIELYIDKGKDASELNRKAFQVFFSNKEKIESDFGEGLEWDCRENIRKCSIKWTLNEGGLKDEDKWSYIQDKLIDAMIRLDNALKKYFPQLPW